MWMMGYNDGGEFNMPDSFSGRKLRPLIPRTPPAVASTNNNISNSVSPPRLRSLHGSDFFSLNQHLASMADQSKRDFHTQPVLVSSRWNPTPEQLRTLEELYRRGTRTPSAEQIQHITAQLRRYGKIEGKNVFYWFQNHKARERQKRRRQMESSGTEYEQQQQQLQQQQQRQIEIFERTESEANRTSYEGEQTKNWAPSPICSTLLEESISVQREAAKAGSGVAEFRSSSSSPDGWIQFDHEIELQQRRNFVERNGIWQMMQLSSPSSTNLINTTSSTITGKTTTTTTTATILAAQPTTTTETTKVANTTAYAARPATTIRTMDPKLIKTAHDFNIFIAPYRENYNGHHGFINHFSNGVINEEDSTIGCGDSQTLQLLPLRSSGCVGGGGDGYINGNGNINYKDTETSSAAVAAAAAMNANFSTPYQFFEFLPLKN